MAHGRLEFECEKVGGSYSCSGGSEPPPPADTTPPRVQSTVPTANATSVAPGANITATFSEAMNTNTIDGSTFKLMKAGTTTAISAVVSYDAAAKKALLNPNSNLQLGTKYKAVVTLLQASRHEVKTGIRIASVLDVNASGATV